MVLTNEVVEGMLLDHLINNNYESGDRIYNQEAWGAVFGSKHRCDVTDIDANIFESVIETLPDFYPEMFKIVYRFYPDIEFEESFELCSNEVAYYPEERILIDKNTGEIVSGNSSEVYRDVIIL